MPFIGRQQHRCYPCICHCLNDRSQRLFYHGIPLFSSYIDKRRRVGGSESDERFCQPIATVLTVQYHLQDFCCILHLTSDVNRKNYLSLVLFPYV
jgi:hypothetical protein